MRRRRSLLVVSAAMLVLFAALLAGRRSQFLARVFPSRPPRTESAPAAPLVRPAADPLEIGADAASERRPLGPDAVARCQLEVRLVPVFSWGEPSGADASGLDVRVHAPSGFESSGKSDAQGHVSLEVPAGLELQVWVPRGDRTRGAQGAVAPLAPGERRALELELTLEDDLNYCGRVTRSGAPVAGARVAFLEDPAPGAGARVLRTDATPWRELRTDADGRFAARVSTARELDVWARAPGLGQVVVGVAPGHETPAQAQELPLVPVGDAEVHVEARGVVPIESLEIRLSCQTFDQLPAYDVYAHAPVMRWEAGFDATGVARLADVTAEVRLDLEVRAGERVLVLRPAALVLAAGVTTRTEIVLDPAGRIDGSVTDPLQGDVAGLEIVLFAATDGADDPVYLGRLERTPELRSARTDGLGRFQFDEVPLGAWTVGLAPSSEGVAPFARVVTLTHTAPRAEVELPLHRGLFVSGRIVDADGGGVVAELDLMSAGVGVHLAQAISHADGSFALGPLPPGACTLHVLPRDGSVRPPPLQTTAGVSDLRIVLARGARITGRLLQADGGELPAEIDVAACTLERPWIPVAYGSIDLTSGTYLIGGLGAGSYLVRATCTDGAIGLKSGIHLDAGQSLDDVTIDLAAGTWIRMHYEGSDPRATIRLTQDGLCFAYVQLERGVTERVQCAPGTVAVRLERENAKPSARSVAVRIGEELDLPIRDED